MTYVLSVRHRVADFDGWKAVFDQRLDARREGKVLVGRRDALRV